VRKQASILLRKNNARITYLVSASSSATGRMGKEWPGGGGAAWSSSCSRNARPEKGLVRRAHSRINQATLGKQVGMERTRAVGSLPGLPRLARLARPACLVRLASKLQPEKQGFPV
jgi:hypothetical protein